ncbi:siderophore-interacting protein [Arthrobacter sp. zg-Y40]|uniref:siderophore-interacting protein n=1 Tax=unclassified Arthrobacter TaxID=235627 RepID=UPI001D15458F|nr:MULTISPECIES: siderophore-interacting protein [unclassified Arthrobacter]MCC3275187.1 siderophore-interacting protein [Arthrobacter sp. zg-Y20]MCC3278264.1 siderophore-interacting protein [Arthrobacter sp. zg-Y40]MDK1315344.1 siderophore-interacting protein [Arthrobacter sp. zg.Y20]MDK1326663.1 siderophore-interacting protein [Arthrobacter sp. zg-Y1143]WIB07888.1 siderophore-interacting protein [Arthrobacter sp. zg-Y20]
MSFDVEVKRIVRLGANFQRITFAGACLSDFGISGETHDLRIKVIVPCVDAEGTSLPLPDLSELSAGWYQDWLKLNPATRGCMRTYTVRGARCTGPEPEIDVDFVLHFDEDGNGGPASSWAAAAQPGDRVCIIGPNAAQCVTAEAYGGIEWRPGMARHVLLAGDETAVPAITAILESLPEDVTGHALMEIPSTADRQPVRTASGVQMIWLARGNRPHGELLDAAVRQTVALPGWASVETADGVPFRQRPALSEPEEINVDEAILWETPQRLDPAAVQATPNPHAPSGALPFYAWIAGEAAVVRGLRRYLVRDVGIDRKQVAFMGYWRKGRAES